ncbi:MAG: hypothetical protein ACX939_03155 [Hyphococcus sp.]
MAIQVDKTHRAFASIEKIARARRKLDNLTRSVNDYCRTNAPALEVVPAAIYRNGDTFQIFASLKQPIPIDFVHEAAEIGGHLRSALDKILMELVDLNGRGTSQVGFPFGGIDPTSGKAEPYPSPRHDGVKKKLTSDQWTLIIGQKPYPGGNDTLWGINQIANADKHWRGLLAVCSNYGVSHAINAATEGGFAINIIRAQGPMLTEEKPKAEVMLYTGAHNINIQSTGTAQVVFGDIAPFQGKELIVSLNAALGECESVVELISSTFFDN